MPGVRPVRVEAQATLGNGVMFCRAPEHWPLSSDGDGGPEASSPRTRPLSIYRGDQMKSWHFVANREWGVWLHILLSHPHRTLAEPGAPEQL